MKPLGTFPKWLARSLARGARAAGRILRVAVPWCGRLLLVVVPLALIAYGAYLVYPPAGFLVPGLLWWLDNYLPATRRRVVVIERKQPEET